METPQDCYELQYDRTIYDLLKTKPIDELTYTQYLDLCLICGFKPIANGKWSRILLPISKDTIKFLIVLNFITLDDIHRNNAITYCFNNRIYDIDKPDIYNIVDSDNCFEKLLKIRCTMDSCNIENERSCFSANERKAFANYINGIFQLNLPLQKTNLCFSENKKFIYV